MPAEHLWTDRQLMGFTETVSTMRKIRTAATTVGGPPQGILDRAASLVRRGEQTPAKSSEVVLFDAEKLGSATGNFVAAHLSKTSSGEIEFEEWQDTLSDAQRDYRRYKGSTYAKTDMLEVVGNSMIGRLRNLSIDPSYMMRWDLILNNNLDAKDLNELIRKNIGVISPLSGDYLMACTYSSYLERTRGRSFPVKPAALSGNLKVVVLPKDQEGRPVFELVSELGMYIDTTDTGNTGKVLYEAVREEYPGKTVHQPPIKGIDFEQSRKMKDFWRRAGN